MIQQAIDYVSACFGFLVSKVDTVFDTITGSKGLILGIFTMLITIRLLLSPLFGGSDGAIGRARDEEREVRRSNAVSRSKSSGGKNG